MQNFSILLIFFGKSLFLQELIFSNNMVDISTNSYLVYSKTLLTFFTFFKVKLTCLQRTLLQRIFINELISLPSKMNPKNELD